MLKELAVFFGKYPTCRQGAREKIALAQSEAPEKKREAWWAFCPVCGSKVISHKYRFVCSNPECHYFQSCSEFDM